MAKGGLGSLGTAVRPVADLRRQWDRVRELTDRPFAINQSGSDTTSCGALAEDVASVRA
ncbi:hypothetical protein ACQEV2_40630 [Streptomyces sp. CA-251387]|uniref:hypothetical protein n=1 Tax=Streptomyces sp. CA-251387 TaxID=3240064 RepID=UPI003D93AE5C